MEDLELNQVYEKYNRLYRNNLSNNIKEEIRNLFPNYDNAKFLYNTNSYYENVYDNYKIASLHDKAIEILSKYIDSIISKKESIDLKDIDDLLNTFESDKYLIAKSISKEIITRKLLDARYKLINNEWKLTFGEINTDKEITNTIIDTSDKNDPNSITIEVTNSSINEFDSIDIINNLLDELKNYQILSGSILEYIYNECESLFINTSLIENKIETFLKQNNFENNNINNTTKSIKNNHILNDWIKKQTTYNTIPSKSTDSINSNKDNVTDSNTKIQTKLDKTPDNSINIKPDNKKMIIKISIVTLTILIIFFSVFYFAYYRDYLKDKNAIQMYSMADNLSFRSEPSIEDRTFISKINFGDKLLVYKINGEWAEVKNDGLKGYIHIKYLDSLYNIQILQNLFTTNNGISMVEKYQDRKAILNFIRDKNILVPGISNDIQLSFFGNIDFNRQCYHINTEVNQNGHYKIKKNKKYLAFILERETDLAQYTYIILCNDDGSYTLEYSDNNSSNKFITDINIKNGKPYPVYDI